MGLRPSFLKYFSFIFFVFLLSCSPKIKEETPETIAGDSLAVLNESITKNPDRPDLYQQRAEYHLEHSNYNNSLADINQAIVMDSTKAIYYLTLSDIYFATDKTRDSKAALEKAVAVEPNNTTALLKLGELYFLVKKYQEAFDYINKALKVDPYIARGYFMKGMIYKEMKDTAKAISSMITAVEQDQKYYDAYMQLGLLYADKKDKLAIDYLNNALRIKPKSEEALYAKGKFYQDLEDWDNSIAIYTELITQFPDNKYVHYNLGVINGGVKKDYETAIKNFDAAIKIDPEYFQAYYGKGTCYELIGDKKIAIENYREALKIKADYAPAMESIRSLTR